MATIPNSGSSPRARDRHFHSSVRRPLKLWPPNAGRDEILDVMHGRLVRASDQVELHDALDDLILLLRDARDHSANWTEWIQAIRDHRILGLIHEDPFTRRAFTKPRGYPGDAELMDFIYGIEEFWPTPPASFLGRQIFQYTTSSPAPEGVRARRAYISRRIDALTDTVPQPEILSVAAGHLREAALSSAVRRRQVGRLLAIDADQASMDLVQAEYGRFGVETATVHVRELLGGPSGLGQFDLIYSTGLFDYLGDSSSARLLSRLFANLKSNGRLIVANFLPGIRDAGYMEAFMDWHLIFRTRREMMDMTMEIAQEEIKGIKVFAEDTQNIIFVEVIRQ